MVQTAEGRVARLLVVVGLAIASVSLGACTPVRMTVPSDVQADSEVFEAKGRSWASGMLGACCHNDAEAQNAGILSQPTSSNRWNGPMRKVMA